ncbi:RNase P subunit p30 family protein [Halorussus sp. MSC15.2]|uniref:RNase P subunit p30 family protein n=1 Tax=Halorussus sp. MSC15.2 TaxID=2283638 RepID=UPI0013D58EC1|nr:RNase P subunit p30 family protein [Halorussus sp. MSC15.2]NEU56214.1 ribonuclease P [Halorussus sp. MSC15.2]
MPRYEGVHAYPDGDSTVARFAATAAEYDFDGVVVRNHSDATGEYDAERIADEYGVDVVDAIEIRADDPETASGHVGNYRPKHTVLALHGGTNALNRFAVESDRVDVLAHPMRGRGDFNHVLAKAAVEHHVHVEFDLSQVLRSDGGPRVQALQDLRKLREIVEKYDTPYVVSANPTSHLQLRAPRELVAVGETVGFSADQIRAGLRAWADLAERNRERMSDAFIAPGVKRGRYEEEP